MVARYIVWQDQERSSSCSVSDLIRDVPEVEILRVKGHDSALVLMDPEAEGRIRRNFPQLSVELDGRYSLATSSR